jgi:perosamine synthetase
MKDADGAPNRPDQAAQAVPLSAPEIRGNEWRYVKECLDTAWVSSVGAFVDRFESALAAYVGKQHAVATVNGTASLHTALRTAGVAAGEEVVTSTLTFIAPANTVRYAGAWPVFIDADPQYWQMDIDKLRHFLDEQCVWRSGSLYNKQTDRRVTAILPVDALGHPADMQPILELARKYGLIVIEDASESLGASYRGRPVGRHGDISCFSFNGNKILTTGGGGMLMTDNADWARRARHLTTQAKADPIEYIHDEVGYNYRLTNIQAAVGVAQLEQLDAFVAAKRRIAATYARTLGGLPGITPMPEAPWARCSFWLYSVLIDPRAFGIDARQLLHGLRAHGIESRPLWQPLHLSPAHRGSFATDCSVAERLNATALSLPSSVGLTEATQSRVIDCIKRIAAEVRPVARWTA